MDIWILVIALLAIAVVLLIASFYVRDGHNIDEKIEELQIQQSEELFGIKSRITEIERELKDPASLFTSQVANVQLAEETTPAVEEMEITEISDLTKEEVIRLYSQGFTMQEIADDVALTINTVQLIVDDYIENR